VFTVNDLPGQAANAEWMGRLVTGNMGLSVGLRSCTGSPTASARREYGAGQSPTARTTSSASTLPARQHEVSAWPTTSQARAAPTPSWTRWDSILIDEGRAPPLIISGPSEESTDKYYKINKVIPGLVRDRDFTVDEEGPFRWLLTDEGVEKVESKLAVPNLYDPRADRDPAPRRAGAAARTTLYRKDHEYVVKDGEVIIVDDFHRAPDAGSALERRPAPGGGGEGERQDRGTRTRRSPPFSFQNYFRLLHQAGRNDRHPPTPRHRSFAQIYKLEVLVQSPQPASNHPQGPPGYGLQGPNARSSGRCATTSEGALEEGPAGLLGGAR